MIATTTSNSIREKPDRTIVDNDLLTIRKNTVIFSIF